MKQYMMVCNEPYMQMFSSMFKPEAVQFIELQGMSVQENKYNILVTPVVAPVEQVEQPVQEAE